MLNQNQFGLEIIQGALSALPAVSTFPCQIDVSEVGALVAGQAVTMVDSAGGVPKIIAAASDADDIFGFINYNQKDKTYVAGEKAEVSAFRGNVMYMTASAAIARFAKVMIVVSGSKVATATTGKVIVGRALDKAAADGDLIRVYIDLPGTVA